MWFATVADGVFDHIAPGKAPLSSAEVKLLLLETFGGWHDPIADLLRATTDEHIVWEDACAMSASGMRRVAAAGSAASAAASRLRLRPKTKPSSRVCGVVLVGDAAHTVRTIPSRVVMFLLLYYICHWFSIRRSSLIQRSGEHIHHGR